jgi:hypothetical protein
MTLERGRGKEVKIPREVQEFIVRADKGEYRDVVGEPKVPYSLSIG